MTNEPQHIKKSADQQRSNRTGQINWLWEVAVGLVNSVYVDGTNDDVFKHMHTNI